MHLTAPKHMLQPIKLAGRIRRRPVTWSSAFTLHPPVRKASTKSTTDKPVENDDSKKDGDEEETAKKGGANFNVIAQESR